MAIDIRKSISIRPNPGKYIMDEPLRKAVEVALAFNQPLLLTGEPGTGKTLLAYKVAAELHQQTKDLPLEQTRFAAEPLRFNTKTDSIARDLFYTYDAIGHFQQANLSTGNRVSLLDFLELQALGMAIANTNPQLEYNQYFRWQRPTYPESSVVLIDEIDKAPRDFTNDILNEIERREFFIKEQRNYRVAIGDDNPQRILLIMTSNSEKNLPDAFLRRCVFYSIPFPDDQRLADILEAQLESSLNAAGHAHIHEIIRLFGQIRERSVRKKPATAELVAFAKMLELDGMLGQSSDKNYRKWYEQHLSLLLKTDEDRRAVLDFLRN